MCANFNLLFKIHLALGILALLIFGIGSFSDGLTEFGKIFLPLSALFWSSLHLSIAWGCKLNSNKARIASRVCGFLFMPFAPVGTILGLILFENTKKQCESART